MATSALWPPSHVAPRGRLTPNAPLAKLVWFKSGGAADWLFEPEDLDDLLGFLGGLDENTPVMALGLGSNLIIRDGGRRAEVAIMPQARAWRRWHGRAPRPTW